ASGSNPEPNRLTPGTTPKMNLHAASSETSPGAYRRKPVIFVHQDRFYRPDQWHHRFIQALSRASEFTVDPIDLLDSDITTLEARATPADALIGRFGHRREDLQVMRQLHPRLHAMFGGKVFPARASYEIY